MEATTQAHRIAIDATLALLLTGLAGSQPARSALEDGGATRALEELLDPGRYRVGIHGLDRDGNASSIRSLTLAIRAGEGKNRDSQVLAEALAWQTEDLLLSIASLPGCTTMPVTAWNVPRRDPEWGEFVLSRQQGLTAAKQLGHDALLIMAVDANPAPPTRATYQLLDMADQTEAASGTVEGASALEVVRKWPATLQAMLESVGLQPSESDKRLFATPCFSAEEYLRAGKVLVLAPALASADEARSFVKEQPDSGLAQVISRRTFAEDTPAADQLTWLGGWVERFATSAPVVLELAALQFPHDDPHRSDCLSRYEALRPGSFESMRLRFCDARGADEHEEAIRLAKEMVWAWPMSAVSWSSLAAAHRATASDARGGHYLSKLTPDQVATFSTNVELARQAVERAVELGPENAVILAQAIRLRRETGDVDGCKAALDQCDAVHPGYAPAYEEMEWVYKAGYENDEPARVAVLRRLDRSKPLGVADEIDIARFLGSRAPFEVCKAHFDRALGRTPAYYPRGLRMLADDVMDAMYCWGGNARTGEQFALDYANRCLTKSIEQHPTFQARRTLARVALLGRHFEDAEKQLKALAEERPEDAQIRKLLADTQRARGEFEAAAVNYEAAEKGSTYRGWDAVLLYAGRLQCLALTDPEKARATLAADLAEAQQKGSPPEAYPLQVYYLAAQQFDEVEKVADEAKARGDVEWPVWLNVGLAHMGRGNWQGALQAFEAARALPGADVRLKVATMVCDWKLGKAQEARRVWGEVEAADFRWLTVARLRENLWPPVAVEAFKELKAAQALPDQ